VGNINDFVTTLEMPDTLVGVVSSAAVTLKLPPITRPWSHQGRDVAAS
jgi:hypothetical protein